MSLSSARALDAATQEALAARLTSLHVPGDPVVMANVYDGATAKLVIANSHVKAVATASFAIAATHGLDDNDLTLAQNCQAVATIASVVIPSGKPLTVDLQDGYEDVAHSIRTIISLGAVGCNLEDVDCKAKPSSALRNVEDAVSRVKTARQAAVEMGVPSFALNARTDALLYGGTVEEAIARGKRYLDAGATNVFVWGGNQRGVSGDEVKRLVEGLQGKLNVKMNLRTGFLTLQEIKALGVARVSVGPELFRKAIASYKDGVDAIFGAA
jgi:2-methylisocitrate lyase-like PEP mutase family enzyme